VAAYFNYLLFEKVHFSMQPEIMAYYSGEIGGLLNPERYVARRESHETCVSSGRKSSVV
jgi:hypothetical protein